MSVVVSEENNYFLKIPENAAYCLQVKMYLKICNNARRVL